METNDTDTETNSPHDFSKQCGDQQPVLHERLLRLHTQQVTWELGQWADQLTQISAAFRIHEKRFVIYFAAQSSCRHTVTKTTIINHIKTR